MGTAIEQGVAPSVDGLVVQAVHNSNGAVVTSTTSIPFDNTTPQNTEGVEYTALNTTITPTAASNKLVIEIVIYYGTSGATDQLFALFQDSTADAIATAVGSYCATNETGCVAFRHEMTAGTTSATTFKVRFGTDTGGGVHTNAHNPSNPVFNGTLASHMRVTEYGPGLTAPVLGNIAELIHIRDEKSSGTDAGGSTAGAYSTRDLNTIKTNEISGASLSSNQITLPAGTYYVEASAPALALSGTTGNAHKIKLRNTTDASDTIIGAHVSSTCANDNGMSRSTLSGRFTIGASKVFELQHRTTQTRGTDGFGRAVSFGDVEVYSEILIWKIDV